MSEELTQKLEQSVGTLIDWLNEAVPAGKDFVAEQAPLVISEIVAWGVMEASIHASLFALGAMVFGTLTVYMFKKKPFVVKDDFTPSFMCGVVFLVTFGVMTGGIITHALILARIHTAPRLYIMEQLQTLI